MSRQEQDDDRTVKQSKDEKLQEGLKNQIEDYWEKKHSKTYHGYREGDLKKPNRQRQITPKKIFLTVIVLVVVLVAGTAGTVFALQAKGKKALTQSNIAETTITAAEDATVENGGKTIRYNGHTYRYKENITTILCMGIDVEDYGESSAYQSGGMADSIFLIVIDTDTGATTMIPISRYTMVEIDEYHKDGSYYRQNEIQVNTAYAYGDGRQASCENMVTAISRLMYGMPISGYMTIDLPGISILNDAIGGVTVEVIEDLTYANPQFYVGNTVTLTGQDAETYVRSRKSEGSDLEIDNNAPRMERQVEYLNEFMKQVLGQIRQKPTLPLTLLNVAKDYILTDVSTSEITYLATLMASHGLDNTIVSIPGTAQKGEYTEVYVDNDALYDIILDVFYEQTD
jgi:LCP family protein required for cell wall assembly